MRNEAAIKLLESAAANLSEHFESVQILASFPVSTGGTQFLSAGRGNWYARQGMAKAFLDSDQAATIAYEINKTHQ